VRYSRYVLEVRTSRYTFAQYAFSPRSYPPLASAASSAMPMPPSRSAEPAAIVTDPEVPSEKNTFYMYYRPASSDLHVPTHAGS
jgi:hypothetical protein